MIDFGDDFTSNTRVTMRSILIYRRKAWRYNIKKLELWWRYDIKTLSLLLPVFAGNPWVHYADVIMTKMTSQITSLTVVYSTVYSDADQIKHQSSASLAFVWGIHRDRWIPRTKGQLRGKCFHLMTSSCTFPAQRVSNSELSCFLCC